jgi:hypothetical protein
MQFKYAAIAALCLAEQASTVSAKNFMASLLEEALSPRYDLTVDYSQLNKRIAQEPEASSSIVPSKAVINATEQACIDRLANLNGVASSPTGMSVCYDVSSLNMTTGEFVSQIYLWQVSPATGNWTNIDSTSLNVDIAYSGANLTKSAVTKRFVDGRIEARSTNPVLITSESFSGKVVNGWSSTNQ